MKLSTEGNTSLEYLRDQLSEEKLCAAWRTVSYQNLLTSRGGFFITENLPGMFISAKGVDN